MEGDGVSAFRSELSFEQLQEELARTTQEVLALREQNARFRVLSEIAPVGMFHTDAAGNCLYVNPRWCHIAGMNLDEALGRGWVRAIDPEDREWVDSEWYRSAQARTPFRMEYRFRRPDGVVTWVLGQAAAQEGPQGEVAGYVGTITDITERREMEAMERRIAELSTPLIPLADDVIVMPLVGTIERTRAEQILQTLLSGITHHQARVAILDVTGIRTVDAFMAEALMRAAQAAGLLGADVVLTGIRSEVAQTLVELGVSLTGVVTRSTLKTGIAYAMGSQREMRRG
jgi:rsbT co-antagonist protein RsbR